MRLSTLTKILPVVLLGLFATAVRAEDELIVAEAIADSATIADADTYLTSSGNGDHGKYDECDDVCGGCDDCKPLFRVKARVFFDSVWSGDYHGAVPSPLERSRFSVDDSRVGFEGWLRDRLFYRAEASFVRSNVNFAEIDDVFLGDVYLEATEMPLAGNIRVGHFIEPFSLERQSRLEFVSAMERSAATRNFAPGRNLGVMAYDHLPNNKNISWFAGVFRGNKRDDFSNSASDDWAVTGRVAAALHYDECNQRFLHVGFGATARRTGGGNAVSGNGLWDGHVPLGNLRSLIRTQLRANTELQVYNMEVAWARGPLTIQGEGYHAEANSPNHLYMSGAYAQVSYLLTGESREYDRKMKAFDRVHPFDPVLGGCERGCGAWELVARYGYMDLNDVESLAGVNSVPPTVIGDQNDFTAGVNWYLSSNARVMFNYVHSSNFLTFIGTSTADSYGMRFAWDY